MALHPEQCLRARRERVPGLLRGVTALLNQPAPANIWLTRIAGAVIVGLGLFSAGIMLLGQASDWVSQRRDAVAEAARWRKVGRFTPAVHGGGGRV